MNLDKSKILSSGKELNLFQTMTTFDAHEENGVLKTSWEKGKSS